MGSSGPRWVVVDKLVHELGSLRALVEEVEAQPAVSQDDVALELRSSLARAADSIHLVIGGNEGMLAQARRTIAEAQQVGERARLALQHARASGRRSRAIPHSAKAEMQVAGHIDDLLEMHESNRPARDGVGGPPGPTRVRSKDR